ncbi:hypothetical protein V8F06_001287 [Rhypophila decipiens]
MVASIHASGAQPSPIPFHRPLFLLLVIRLVFCFFLDPSCQVLVHPRSTAKPNVCHIPASTEARCFAPNDAILYFYIPSPPLSFLRFTAKTHLTFSYSPFHFSRLVLAQTKLHWLVIHSVSFLLLEQPSFVSFLCAWRRSMLLTAFFADGCLLPITLAIPNPGSLVFRVSSAVRGTVSANLKRRSRRWAWESPLVPCLILSAPYPHKPGALPRPSPWNVPVDLGLN